MGAFSPLVRNWLVLAAAGIVYGLALYVVNFQIPGNTIFEWFTNPQGPNQGFEVFIHAVFGLPLVPFSWVSPLASGRPRRRLPEPGTGGRRTALAGAVLHFLVRRSSPCIRPPRAT